MVVGIDDSEHSMYALQWTLDHFFTPLTGDGSLFKLVVVHSKPTPSSVVSLAGRATAEVLPIVDSDLKKIAARVLEKTKSICTANQSVSIYRIRIELESRKLESRFLIGSVQGLMIEVLF
ncbi:hypothetical protein LINPERPRIM_LOCUS36999 [Linum perenne]